MYASLAPSTTNHCTYIQLMIENNFCIIKHHLNNHILRLHNDNLNT